MSIVKRKESLASTNGSAQFESEHLWGKSRSTVSSYAFFKNHFEHGTVAACTLYLSRHGQLLKLQ